MKLAISQKDLTMHGMGERVKFTVRADAHIMKVLSNLYEYPEKAMLREYLTNMYDAYVALKIKDASADFVQPVLVLPTSLSPFLEFRDYGIGMSVQQVMEVYTQYGNSTKNENNQEVGGFGLGSKTAFCYNGGQTWYIETRWNGKKHTFAAFLDEEQIPTLSPVTSEDTTEHNGVTIKVPILRKDIKSVHEAAEQYVPYFPLPLTVENYTIAPLNYSVKANAWGMLKVERWNQYYTKVMVVVGSVPYEFDLSALGGKEYPSGLPFGAIDLFIPVGSVDIVPSRDSLQITDRTKRAVKSAMAQLISELPAAVTDTVRSQATAAEAAANLKDVLKLFSFEYSIATGHTAARNFADGFVNIKWNGISLMSYIDHAADSTTSWRNYFVGVTSTITAIFPKDAVTVYGRLHSFGGTISEIENVSNITIDNEHTLVILNDNVRGPVRIARGLADQKLINRNMHTGRRIRYGHKAGYVVMITSSQTPKEIAQLLNIPEAWVELASKLKGTLKLKSGNTPGADNIYRFYNKRWVSRVRIPDEKDGPFYYLPLEKLAHTHKWESSFDSDEVQYLMRVMETMEVYGIKKADSDDLDDSVWINLETASREKIETHLKNNLSEWVTPDTQGYESDDPFYEVVTVIYKSVPDDDLAKYVVEYQKVTAQSKKTTAHHGLPFEGGAIRALKIDWEAKVKNVSFYDLAKAKETLKKKYPVLNMVMTIVKNRYVYRGWGQIVTPFKKVLLDSMK